MFSVDSVNQQIYDNLLLLQHRGQDSAGIVTMDNYTFHVHKQRGRVREAFRTRDMRKLHGNVGIGHVRYATSGAAAADQRCRRRCSSSQHHGQSNGQGMGAGVGVGVTA